MVVTIGGEWKQFQGYEVSSIGDVRKRINVNHPERCKPYAVLKKQFDKDGYVYYRLNAKKYLAHRLVYLLFVGDLIDGLVVCHADGNKTNNRPSNLLQATQKENIHHKKLHGTWQTGERHPNAKLTNQKAIEVFAAVKDGIKTTCGKLKKGEPKRIANECGVSVSSVHSISRERRSYKDALKGAA